MKPKGYTPLCGNIAFKCPTPGRYSYRQPAYQSTPPLRSQETKAQVPEELRGGEEETEQHYSLLATPLLNRVSRPMRGGPAEIDASERSPGHNNNSSTRSHTRATFPEKKEERVNKKSTDGAIVFIRQTSSNPTYTLSKLGA
jgi:hypothetical protein